MKLSHFHAPRTSYVVRVGAFALALFCAATAIAGVNDGMTDSLEFVASAPTGAVAQPSPIGAVQVMPAEWLMKHDVRAPLVQWNVMRLPTALGFQVEVTAHTPAGLQLAVRCENAGTTMDKVKFTTGPVDVVNLKFDQAWFRKGERLDLACTAGGQRHIEHLIA